MNANDNLKFQVGVCLPETELPNAAHTSGYAHYIHEILEHAGLCYLRVSLEELPQRLPQLGVLVSVGQREWPAAVREALRPWLESGGSWLSIGGTAGMPDIFGVRPRPPAYTGVGRGGQSATLGEGYLHAVHHAHPVTGGIAIPLHFFNGAAMVEDEAATGISVLARASNAHQHEGPLVSVVERRAGSGRAILVAPDAVGAVVRIQQGVAITRDGVPASDGTAPVSDGVLKCDDGAVLDWTFDRQELPGAPGLPCFLEPIADHWRGLLLRAIFYLAQETGVPLALLWQYPRNLPALAHISFDSDLNNPALAYALLKLCHQARARTTWCIIMPGYGADVIEAIKAGGHELATHYDALDHPWGEEEFDAQWQALCRQFGERPVSNKNHYTRWEGDTEFFEWCARRDIGIDGSKGPSKVGEAGFLFGTSQPHFPLDPAGQVMDVLELPFLTQDIELFAPKAVIGPFVAATLDVHGVMHLLFHPGNIGNPGVPEALLEAARAAQDAGMECWTSRQINNWERGRRQVKWDQESRAKVTLESGTALAGATLLFLPARGRAFTVKSVSVAAKTAARWGFEFEAVTLDIDAGQRVEITLDNV